MWWMAVAPPSLRIATATAGTRVTQTRRPLQAVTPARRPAPAALTTSTRLTEAPVLQRKLTKVWLNCLTYAALVFSELKGNSTNFTQSALTALGEHNCI